MRISDWSSDVCSSDLEGVHRNNLDGVDVAFPLGVFTAVTGVSGSGKSSLVSQVLVELLGEHLGHDASADPDEGELPDSAGPGRAGSTTDGRIVEGLERVRRLVRVDQKPIGRTPRSNLAPYTGTRKVGV